MNDSRLEAEYRAAYALATIRSATAFLAQDRPAEALAILRAANRILSDVAPLSGVRGPTPSPLAPRIHETKGAENDA
jgi:hypothetical protein